MNAHHKTPKPGGTMERRWSRKKRVGRAEAEASGAPEVQPEPEAVQASSEPSGGGADLRRAALDILREPAQTIEPQPKDIPDASPDIAPQETAKAELEPSPGGAEAQAEVAPTPIPTVQGGSGQQRSAPDLWQRVPSFPLDLKHLEKNRIITAERTDPAHSAFDVLRTKLLRLLSENGWSRIAVTSPTEGCGKTFMSVNLALSLSRQANCRTVLMDLDMRRPSVAKVLGLKDPGSMGDFLRGDLAIEDLFRRAGPNDVKIGDNVMVAANGRREDYASELMQLPETAEAMDRMEEALAPDVILFDMPPALVNDDVLAARPLFDGVLLIIGGGITKPQQVRDVERRLGTETPLLGVVLNRSEGENAQSYSY